MAYLRVKPSSAFASSKRKTSNTDSLFLSKSRGGGIKPTTKLGNFSSQYLEGQGSSQSLAMSIAAMSGLGGLYVTANKLLPTIRTATSGAIGLTKGIRDMFTSKRGTQSYSNSKVASGAIEKHAEERSHRDINNLTKVTQKGFKDVLKALGVNQISKPKKKGFLESLFSNKISGGGGGLGLGNAVGALGGNFLGNLLKHPFKTVFLYPFKNLFSHPLRFLGAGALLTRLLDGKWVDSRPGEGTAATVTRTGINYLLRGAEVSGGWNAAKGTYKAVKNSSWALNRMNQVNEAKNLTRLGLQKEIDAAQLLKTSKIGKRLVKGGKYIKYAPKLASLALKGGFRAATHAAAGAAAGTGIGIGVAIAIEALGLLIDPIVDSAITRFGGYYTGVKNIYDRAGQTGGVISAADKKWMLSNVRAESRINKAVGWTGDQIARGAVHTWNGIAGLSNTLFNSNLRNDYHTEKAYRIINKSEEDANNFHQDRVNQIYNEEAVGIVQGNWSERAVNAYKEYWNFAKNSNKQIKKLKQTNLGREASHLGERFLTSVLFKEFLTQNYDGKFPGYLDQKELNKQFNQWKLSEGYVRSDWWNPNSYVINKSKFTKLLKNQGINNAQDIANNIHEFGADKQSIGAIGLLGSKARDIAYINTSSDLVDAYKNDKLYSQQGSEVFNGQVSSPATESNEEVATGATDMLSAFNQLSDSFNRLTSVLSGESLPSQNGVGNPKLPSDVATTTATSASNVSNNLQLSGMKPITNALSLTGDKLTNIGLAFGG